jgi:hypothetical protein
MRKGEVEKGREGREGKKERGKEEEKRKRPI